MLIDLLQLPPLLQLQPSCLSSKRKAHRKYIQVSIQTFIKKHYRFLSCSEPPHYAGAVCHWVQVLLYLYASPAHKYWCLVNQNKPNSIGLNGRILLREMALEPSWHILLSNLNQISLLQLQPSGLSSKRKIHRKYIHVSIYWKALWFFYILKGEIQYDYS